MCACLNNDEAEKVFQIFRDIREATGGADAKAYGALISGSVRCGRLADALRFVEEAYCLAPDGHGLNRRRREVDSQHLDSQIDTIVELLEKFREADVSVSNRFVFSMKARLQGSGPSRVDKRRSRVDTGRAWTEGFAPWRLSSDASC